MHKTTMLSSSSCPPPPKRGLETVKPKEDFQPLFLLTYNTIETSVPTTLVECEETVSTVLVAYMLRHTECPSWLGPED
jgi:hypothetical protein